jgi:hypothetical protein
VPPKLKPPAAGAEAGAGVPPKENITTLLELYLWVPK